MGRPDEEDGRITNNVSLLLLVKHPLNIHLLSCRTWSLVLTADFTLGVHTFSVRIVHRHVNSIFSSALRCLREMHIMISFTLFGKPNNFNFMCTNYFFLQDDCFPNWLLRNL